MDPVKVKELLPEADRKKFDEINKQITALGGEASVGTLDGTIRMVPQLMNTVLLGSVLSHRDQWYDGRLNNRDWNAVRFGLPRHLRCIGLFRIEPAKRQHRSTWHRRCA